MFVCALGRGFLRLLYGFIGEHFFKYTNLLRLPSRGSLGDLISFVVFLPQDVHELHALGVLLKLADLLKVSDHVVVFLHVALIGVIDHEL